MTAKKAAAKGEAKAASNSFDVQLNAEQRQAVEHAQGPLLIVAGAGTGKTTVIVERLAWLITEKGLRPDEVLCLTFTDKAANEMLDRIDRRLPTGYVDLWVSTFHGFGERVLRENAIDVGLPGDFQVLSERQQWMFLRQHLDALSLDYYRPHGRPTKFLQSLIKHFSRLKDEVVSPERYLAFVEEKRLNLDQSEFTKKEDKDAAGEDVQRLQELASSFHLYNRLLRERGFVDFGDLIVETLKLFQTRSTLLQRYRNQFKAILVDEFQDTNWAQYELVKLLAAPENNLTVVGDDDQSIYKFRGASVANIMQFREDYKDCTSVVLTQNYRSYQRILDTAYNFIQLNNPNRLEVQLQDDGKGLNKRLQAARQGEAKIQELVTSTEDDEAEKVVEQILAQKNADKDLQWSDFAILARANAHLESFLNAAERSGVPYQYVAARGLYRQAVVLDVLAYLRMLDNYHEDIALHRVLTMPIFSFSTQDIITLNQDARRQSRSVYQSLKEHGLISTLSQKTHQEADRLLGLIESHTALALQERRNVSRVLYAFLEDSGYLRYLSDDDDPVKQAQLHYLSQYYREVTDFERGNTEPSVKNFLLLMQASMDAGEEGQLDAVAQEGPDSVKLMTVHAAKGLEFRHVFVVNMVERRFPSSDRGDAISLPDGLVHERLPEGNVHIQEERRLFYVALTRAKDSLTLTRALDYGGATVKRPSPFLIEMGLVTKEQAAEEKKQQSTLLNARVRSAVQSEPESILRKVAEETRYDYSRISTYDLCPWKFRYRYALEVPEPGNKRFSYGQSVHATLYDFFRLVQERSKKRQVTLFAEAPKVNEGILEAGAKSVSLAELKELYERNWIREWYDGERDMEKSKQKGWESLKAFYASYSGDLPVPLALEQPFTIQLSEEFRLTGKIDRIDQIEDSEEVEIIDYKTGTAKEKPSKEAKYQLILYALAVQDSDLLHRKVGKLTFWYIDDNSQVSFVPKEKDLEAAREWVLEQIGQIREADFTADPNPIKCGGCEFKQICPFKAV
ncbi:MAG: ATP-dependent helicase [Candidatus Nomurabacteria bacterium]|nr:MAG: ATP-dependent helicase [Candidatus Nomurabacteria bacterium]